MEDASILREIPPYSVQIFVVINSAVFWGVLPCILVICLPDNGDMSPDICNHCSKDRKYNFCGFLARCVVFRWDFVEAKGL